VRRAGLADILGMTGGENVHGEEVRSSDEFANETIIRAMRYGGNLCAMASEESEVSSRSRRRRRKAPTSFCSIR